MRKTRKQRLIEMRKKVGYHPNHPRKYRWLEFTVERIGIFDKKFMANCRMLQTSISRRRYQQAKKAGV